MKALLTVLLMSFAFSSLSYGQEAPQEEPQVPKAYAMVPTFGYNLVPLKVREVKTYVIDAPARPAYAPYRGCLNCRRSHFYNRVARIENRFARRDLRRMPVAFQYPYPIIVK